MTNPITSKLKNTVTVAKLPECDFAPCEHPATYDFKTKAGPWANGCAAHWKQNRAHKELGVGKGQQLVVAAKPAKSTGSALLDATPTAKLLDHGTVLLTREQWLQSAVPALSARIASKTEHKVPTGIQVSVGFVRGSKKAIGLCIDAKGSVDEKTKNILICPTVGEGVRVLDVLLHELIHAALGAEHGHDKVFAQAARACGLEGKPTAAHAGEALKAELQELLSTLGEYPHVAVKARPGIKKPKPGKSEWVRMYSPTLEGYRINVIRDQVEEFGAPTDPEGDEMVFDNPFS